MFKIKEFNTITLFADKEYLYFNCENGMKAKYNYLEEHYVSNTYSSLGQIYLDGWFENNIEQLKELKKGRNPEDIEFLGPI